MSIGSVMLVAMLLEEGTLPVEQAAQVEGVDRVVARSLSAKSMPRLQRLLGEVERVFGPGRARARVSHAGARSDAGGCSVLVHGLLGLCRAPQGAGTVVILGALGDVML
jgi:hypothetical protein